MAERKKISELDFAESVSAEDEFLMIDRSVVTGDEASESGKTSKVTLNQIESGLFSNGLPQGDKGEKGPQGTSITGDKGIKGQDGDSVTGDKGPQGDSAKGDKGPQGNPSSVPGPKGEVGPPPTITYNASTQTLSISTQ